MAVVHDKPPCPRDSHGGHEPEFESANCIGDNLKFQISNFKSPIRGVHGMAQSFVQAFGLELGVLRPLSVIQHSITRYRITLEVYRGTFILHPSSPLPPGGVCAGMPHPGEDYLWLTYKEMVKLPFASAHRRILGMLLGAEPDEGAIGEQPGNKRVIDREDQVNKKKQPLRALRPRKKL